MKTTFMRLLLIGFLFVAILPLFASGKAEDSGEGIFVDENGIAASGADVVAYWSLNSNEKAILGKPEFSYVWKGATWLFATHDNLQRFIDNPENFAPQYGGFCAYGFAINRTVKTDPEAWTIMDGKLFLNFDLKGRRNWLEKTEEYIPTADHNFADYLDTLFE